MVWVEDYSDGQLVEVEIAFYAQDDDGTVWYFGEHPEEYEDGEFVAAPTWIAGLEDAKPGIKMFADPLDAHPDLLPGLGTSRRMVRLRSDRRAGLSDCVVAGCFNDVDRFAESSDGEAGIFQLKSYAKGIGEIRVGWRGEAETREELELKSTATLQSSALTEVRQSRDRPREATPTRSARRSTVRPSRCSKPVRAPVPQVRAPWARRASPSRRAYGRVTRTSSTAASTSESAPPSVATNTMRTV